MPCRSDYLEAHPLEIEASRVECLIDQLNDGGEIDTGYWAGYHPRVYNRGLGREELDKLTARLCNELQSVDVTKYSLELQIWWRDHQKADKLRAEAERKRVADEELRLQALAKLSAAERKALGLK